MLKQSDWKKLRTQKLLPNINKNLTLNEKIFMKTISFTEDNKESYDLLYEAVRAKPVKGIEEIIKAATVVEKLKECGKEKGEKTGHFVAYELKSVPTNLELEDDYFKYVKSSFEETPFSSSVRIELLSQTAKLLKQAEG